MSTTMSNDKTETKDKSKQHHLSGRSIIQNYCLNTSTHALPTIARSHNTGHCTFWLIAFFVATCIMGYFITGALLAYFDYPTNMSVSYDDQVYPYFAAFSFCNMGALRFDPFIREMLNRFNPIFDHWNFNNNVLVKSS